MRHQSTTAFPILIVLAWVALTTAADGDDKAKQSRPNGHRADDPEW